MNAKNELQNYLTRIIEYNVLVDTTLEKGGTGKCIRPHELLEAALAACMNIAIKMEAQKNNLYFDSIETRVELNRKDPTKTIFEYSYIFNSPDKLSDKTINKFKQVLQTCPVRKTLSKEIIFVEKYGF